MEAKGTKALLGELVTTAKYLLSDYQKNEMMLVNCSHDDQFQEYKDKTLILKCRISVDLWRKEASNRRKN